MTAAVYTSGMASVKLEAGFVTDVKPGDVITLGYSGFEVFSPKTEKALNQTGFHVGKVLGFAATTNKENPIINIGSNKDKSESAMRADSIALDKDFEIDNYKNWLMRVGAAMEVSYGAIFATDAGKLMVEDQAHRRPGMLISGAKIQVTNDMKKIIFKDNTSDLIFRFVTKYEGRVTKDRDGQDSSARFYCIPKLRSDITTEATAVRVAENLKTTTLGRIQAEIDQLILDIADEKDAAAKAGLVAQKRDKEDNFSSEEARLDRIIATKKAALDTKKEKITMTGAKTHLDAMETKYNDVHSGATATNVKFKFVPSDPLAKATVVEGGGSRIVDYATDDDIINNAMKPKESEFQRDVAYYVEFEFSRV